MPNGRVPEATKLKIFISYSRKDEDFAQDLLAGLQSSGFEPYLDKHDIAAGEEWEARLGHLIEAADTVVFVISPDAVASERCAWEVERTVNLKKRLLPIVWRRVDEAQVPPHLKQLNYIFFDRPLSFGASLLVLATALKTDIAWIREHTRIGELALRWHARGRAEALLLRGDELATARAWLAAPPKYASEPALLHHEFIKAGDDAETVRSSAERQRLDQMAAALEREKIAQQEREKALRRGQRALAGAAGLLAFVIVGAIAWYHQQFLKEQYQWHWVMGPRVLTPDKERALKPSDSIKECAHGCPTLIVVPAGTFMMGSPESERGRREDEERHEVTIAKPFAVARTEVTFSEWEACVAANGCRDTSDNNWGRGKRPVIYVTWDDAKQYVKWLSRVTGQQYRLLTEAEWEYAARANAMTRFSFGDDEAALGDYAWFGGIGSGNSAQMTHPVGEKKPNAFGLYDMHGNVYELVEDCYHGNYNRAPSDGSAWVTGNCTERVSRGGSWGWEPDEHRSASRSSHPSAQGYNGTGFRVARTLIH